MVTSFDDSLLGPHWSGEAECFHPAGYTGADERVIERYRSSSTPR